MRTRAASTEAQVLNASFRLAMVIMSCAVRRPHNFEVEDE